jgi:signal transduction histidine kinase
MKPYSLTRRLIATVLFIELVSALCVTGVALFYERHTHFHSFDILLRGRADSMLGAVQDAEDANDNLMLDGTEIYTPSEDIYEVRDARGQLLGRSQNWTGPSGNERIERHRSDSKDVDLEGFFSTEIAGKTYRVIRLDGLRIVDPGDKGGGIRRFVTVYYGSGVKRVWRAVFRAASFYAISSLIVLAATGILMSWLLNRGLAPLRELASGAAKVSVNSWTFTPPEDARRTKELAPLVSALESALTGLERSFEQQKRFVGDAAHELKTSVAVVKSSLQLLSMRQRSTEEYEAGLERCLTDCARMEGIVAQMLTLARLEEGKSTETSASSVDVVPLAQSVVEQLNTMAEANQIRIVVGVCKPLSARIDPEQFKLLCSNLLMNALQHSPPGSTIAVEMEEGPETVMMRIKDQGDGIHPDDLPHIFERFSRSDPSRSRSTGGTGLGLAICKAITDRFKGKIEITSQLKTGTTVVVQFPLAAEKLAEAALPL